MGDHISLLFLISGDSPLDETLNWDPWPQYEFPFGIKKNFLLTKSPEPVVEGDHYNVAQVR